MSPIQSSLALKCPKCGKGKIYSGFLQVAERCSECGFVLRERDTADGPAYVAMCIVGTITTILAFIVERMFEPPLWLHGIIWVPFILGGSLLCLVFLKPLFIALQYKYKVLGFEEEK